MGDLDQRVHRALAREGLQLPAPPRVLGAYEAAVEHGALLFVSGVFGFARETSSTRRADRLAAMEAAAGQAALALVARLRTELGSLDRLASLARIEGHVAGHMWSNQVPRILDEASQTLGRLLGDAGRHARTGFVHGNLPCGAAIELCAIAVLSDRLATADQGVIR